MNRQAALVGIRIVGMGMAIALFGVVAASQSDGAQPSVGEIRNAFRPADVGIAQASDIESVVLRFTSGETRKITLAKWPELSAELYRAVLDLGPVVSRPDASEWHMLLLNLKGGDTVTLCFGVGGPTSGPHKYYINGSESCESFDRVIDRIRRDPKAAALDSRLVVNPSELQVALPRQKPLDIPLSSKEGKALLAKAREILDCLDLRGTLTGFRADFGADISSAAWKFGIVALLFRDPVRLDIYTPARLPPKPVTLEGGFSPSIERREFYCDAMYIMDYGNYIPPVVFLEGSHAGGGLYLFRQFTRRQQEKLAITKYGFPGHAITDKDYYKSPEVLYKELQELAKAAYKKGEPTGHPVVYTPQAP